MTEYTVGSFYSVPALRVRRWYGYTGLVPIVGPEHEDNEILKFPYQHFHVDWRFLDTRMFRSLMIYFSYLRHVGSVSSLGDSAAYGIVVQRAYNDGEMHIVVAEPQPRRMKCKRAWPRYPHHEAAWMPHLIAKFACAKLVNGTCPHRGIPVADMMREGDILTCPGHGLRWNAITGEAVPPPMRTGAGP